MKRYTVEKEWTTGAGLKAAVIMTSHFPSHRCGYVAVPVGHAWFGVEYNAQVPNITKDQVNEAPIDKLSPVIILCAGVNADDEDSIRRSPDIVISVHGGLTYSSAGATTADAGYPVTTSEIVWWFGYDCGHYGDDEDNGGQPLDYCIAECESMATQLQKFAK